MSRTTQPGFEPLNWSPLISTPERDRFLGGLRNAGALGVGAFRAGKLTVIRAREPSGPGGAYAWHLSISHEDRYPSWDEIADARYRLLPAEITVVMYLPPQDEYVNAHDTTFHLHEILG